MSYRFLIGRIILTLLGIGLAIFVTHAQSRTLTKDISQSFHVEKRSTIDLTNKYGQVIIDTWAKDSVLVKVKITAYGKNDEALSKTMERVDVDFKNFGDLLNIETILDRNSSVFQEIINNLGDYSKTLMSKNKISIDYELLIPEDASLVLDNKFGDVYVQSLTQENTINVAHGDFRAEVLTGANKLNLSFGKSRIKKLDKAFVALKGAELDLRDGGDIELVSSSSTFQVNTIQSLKMDSRNDKVRIEKVKSLRGYASFSNILIDSMLDRIDMQLNYGDLMIAGINNNFTLVDLKSKSADLNLSFEMGSYFLANLNGREDRMFLTRNFIGMDKTVSTEDEKIISLTGVVGMIKSKKSSVNVTNDAGEITIYLEDTGGITNKN